MLKVMVFGDGAVGGEQDLGGGPQEGDPCLIKEIPLPLPHERTAVHDQDTGPHQTRNPPCLDLGLLSLQDYEKWISVVRKPPDLWYVCYNSPFRLGLLPHLILVWGLEPNLLLVVPLSWRNPLPEPQLLVAPHDCTDCYHAFSV